MRLINSFVIFVLFLTATASRAANAFVDFNQGDFQLNKGNRVTIGIADNEQRGVLRAAKNLFIDIKTVCGAEVSLGNASSSTIVAGTLGSSKIIDEMAKNRVFDAKMIKGKREMYIIKVTDEQVVIAVVTAAEPSMAFMNCRASWVSPLGITGLMYPQSIILTSI